MSEFELKPCPFCGEKARLVTGTDSRTLSFAERFTHIKSPVMAVIAEL